MNMRKQEREMEGHEKEKEVGETEREGDEERKHSSLRSEDGKTGGRAEK